MMVMGNVNLMSRMLTSSRRYMYEYKDDCKILSWQVLRDNALQDVMAWQNGTLRMICRLNSVPVLQSWLPTLADESGRRDTVNSWFQSFRIENKRREDMCMNCQYRDSSVGTTGCPWINMMIHESSSLLEATSNERRLKAGRACNKRVVVVVVQACSPIYHPTHGTIHCLWLLNPRHQNFAWWLLDERRKRQERTWFITIVACSSLGHGSWCHLLSCFTPEFCCMNTGRLRGL